MKNIFKKPLMALATLFLAFSAIILPGSALAASDTVVAQPHVSPGTGKLPVAQDPFVRDDNGNIVQARASNVAVLTLWAVLVLSGLASIFFFTKTINPSMIFVSECNVSNE